MGSIEKKKEKYPWRTEENLENSERFHRELRIRWAVWTVADIVVTLLLMAVFPNVVKDTFIIATMLGGIVLGWCIEWAFHFLKIRKFRSWRWFAAVGGSILGGFLVALVCVLTGTIR